MKKKTGLIMIMLVMVLTSSAFADNILSQDHELTSFVEHGRVLDVTDFPPLSEEDSYGEMIQEVRVEITSGKYKGGEIHVTDNVLSGHPAFDIPVKLGDEIILQIDEYVEGGDVDVFITDYNRETYLRWLVLGFIGVLVLVGKMKGLKTVATIGVTIVMVWKFIIPGILNGMSPVPITVFSCVVITVVTILLVSGFRKKEYCCDFRYNIGCFNCRWYCVYYWSTC